jgi:cyclophilin family peptidyl-prolyl cis-trans isomerase
LADASKTKAKKQQPTLSTVATSPSEAITDKVQFNIRISRADGSFYIRDDETDDDVYYCRVVVGLFGQAVPNHVQRFLSYCQDGITTTKDNEDSETDTSPISYSRSTFSGMDPISGLLLGGVIPSLSVASVMGGTSSALEYRGRLVPASLWLDPTINGQSPLSHISKGLLTHAKFDVTPSFGITTRSDSRDLDATHRVFGRILFDESDGAYDFLDRIRDLPTYSLERPMGDDPDSMGDLVADAVFSAQRDFFRKFAKNIGDSRIDKLYPGKFLRRVEVTQVTVLK